MQLKENSPELIKEEVFNQVYNQILKGEVKDKNLIDLIFKYFHGNTNLFKYHYQPLEENKSIYTNKKCFACGQKGHLKRYCKLQALVEQEEEEEIEFVISQ